MKRFHFGGMSSAEAMRPPSATLPPKTLQSPPPAYLPRQHLSRPLFLFPSSHTWPHWLSFSLLNDQGYSNLRDILPDVRSACNAFPIFFTEPIPSPLVCTLSPSPGHLCWLSCPKEVLPLVLITTWLSFYSYCIFTDLIKTYYLLNLFVSAY